MTRTPILIALLALAKISGIIGVIAFLAHHSTLGGFLLLADGLLLALTATGSYHAMKQTLLVPIPGWTDYPPLTKLIGDANDCDC